MRFILEGLLCEQDSSVRQKAAELAYSFVQKSEPMKRQTFIFALKKMSLNLFAENATPNSRNIKIIPIIGLQLRLGLPMAELLKIEESKGF